MFTFTNYYDTSPPLWEVVENSMSYSWQFLNCQKGCNYISDFSLLLIEPILRVKLKLP